MDASKFRAESRQMLGFSRAAYYSETDLSEFLSSMGADLLRYMDDMPTGTQGYVARTVSGRLVIAFRGTEPTSIQDIRIDIDRELIPHGPLMGRVHAGFKRALESVSGQIIRSLNLFPGAPIAVTGHSLGAAVATLAALRVIERGPGVECVHLFGSPRVGDGDFALRYNGRLKDVTFRHQNCCDIVSCVPAAWHGYCHVGHLRYYSAGGLSVPGAGLPYRIFDQITARAMDWGRLPTRGIRDHRLNSYLSVLD